MKMFRYVLVDVIQSKEYADIVKSDDFKIYTGELYEEPYVLYREIKNRFNPRELAEYMQLNQVCQNYDLRNYTLSNMDLSGHDFSYTDFRESDLVSVNLNGSKLRSAIFKDCDMSNAKLKRAVLSEANFEGANLTGADLSESASVEGVLDFIDWAGPYNLPLNLHATDLSYAIIEGATFVGTDFTKTKLEGTNFTSTDLFRCKFRSDQVSNLKLSDKQLSQIKVI